MLYHSVACIVGPLESLGLSDDGVESHVIDACDVLPFFYEHVRTGVVPDNPGGLKGTFLCPNAMRGINWNHILDWVLRMVLSVNPFYTAYNADIKELSQFLKARGHRAIIRKSLHAQGKHELAKVLLKFGAKFAHWRWATLVRACRESVRVEEAVREGFDPSLFNLRGGELKRVAEIICTTSKFWERNRFFEPLVSSWNALRSWGLGCPCHDAECREAAAKCQSFECPDGMKSRRCADLREKLVATFETWKRASVNMPIATEPGLYEAMSTSWRGLIFYSDLKLAKMLDHWPYWLWQIRDPLKCKLALAVFDKECSTDGGRNRMHRLGHKFCSPSGAWRAHLGYHAELEGLSPELDEALRTYEDARMDESSVEAPHAAIQKTVDRASNSELLWWSSTLRLSQNLALHSSYVERGAADRFNRCFENYKCVAQLRASKARKLIPCRKPLAQVHDFVYNLDAESLTDWMSFKGLFESNRAFNKSAIRSDVKWIKNDFLECTLNVGEIYTVPVEGYLSGVVMWNASEPMQTHDAGSLPTAIVPVFADSRGPLRVFEVISFDPSNKVLHYNFDLKGFLMPIVIQKFSVWTASRDVAQDYGAESVLQVVPDEFPEVVDAIMMATWPAFTQGLRSWTKAVSDIYGCLQLSQPIDPSRGNWAVGDKGYPAFLMLLDLFQLGWKRSSDSGDHDHMSPLFFCDQGLQSRKSYLRCLLVIQELFGRGLARLSVLQHDAYYRAVLNATKPGEIMPGKLVRVYLEILGDDAQISDALTKRVLEDIPRRSAAYVAFKTCVMPLEDAPGPAECDEIEDDVVGASGPSGLQAGSVSDDGSECDSSELGPSSDSEDESRHLSYEHQTIRAYLYFILVFGKSPAS
jgi:hypothetical protein